MHRVAGLGVVVVVAATLASPAVHVGAATTAAPDRKVIVLLKDSVSSSDAVAAEQSKSRHARVTQVYGAALQGYAASVPADQITALQSDPRVEAVVEDKKTSFEKPAKAPGFPQILPYATDRVDADLSSTKAGDGRGRVNVDVAVVDTGVGPHNDLNIVGGVNCGNVGSKRDYFDLLGHGTGVAGALAAEDNRRDYVGVAPGARIWSVRVINDNQDTELSNVICGIDWITRHASVIDAVNMSIAFLGTDDQHCGYLNHDPLHRAICRMVARGVPIAVAAGNESQDAANIVPAAYDEVMTASALADFDGVPGGLDRDGLGTDPVYGPYCLGEQDDTPAFFTNFGADVDLIAPGVCVETLSPFGYLPDGAIVPDPDGYNLLSGTSLSSPYVAGAAALYKSRHPFASPAQVKAALLAAATYDYDDSGDPDGIKEPLLNVARF